MPHWAWTGLLFAIVVGLFAFILRIGGGEPLDRNDSGGGDWPGDHHSGHGGGDAHH